MNRSPCLQHLLDINSVGIQSKALKDAESVAQEQMDIVTTVLVPESLMFQQLQENLHG